MLLPALCLELEEWFPIHEFTYSFVILGRNKLSVVPQVKKASRLQHVEEKESPFSVMKQYLNYQGKLSEEISCNIYAFGKCPFQRVSRTKTEYQLPNNHRFYWMVFYEMFKLVCHVSEANGLQIAILICFPQ